MIRAIMAGIMVSIGGTVYLSCDNKYIGALLFSVGLMSVMHFHLNLYTGRVGYILRHNKIFFIDTVLSIIGNFIGTMIVGLALQPIGYVESVCSVKMEKSPMTLLIDAIFCGVLIYICMDQYKTRESLLGVFICVPVFLLCGFEHSIADMFYLFNAHAWNTQAAINIGIIILGNAIGALAMAILLDLAQKWEDE